MNNWKQIKDEYLEGASLMSLSKKYRGNITEKWFAQKISDRLKSEGVIIVNRQNERGVNHNLFKSIETEEQAYWLGFLFADGSVNKRNSVIELSLKAGDYEHLVKFKSFVKAKNKIYVDEVRCRYLFSSPRIKDQLITLGCTPQKSLTLKFPDRNRIPKDLMRHFLRGYFDGDGCLSYNKRYGKIHPQCSVLGTLDFLKEFVIEIQMDKNIHKNRNIYGFHLCCKKAGRFLDYLYQDSSVYLNRKYHRYQIFKKYYFAVPVEQSQELLSGNIGGTLSSESKEYDNTEITN
jgi:hypothetical protein